jgi:hypothetical protein
LSNHYWDHYWEKEIFYEGLKAEMVDDVTFTFYALVYTDSLRRKNRRNLVLNICLSWEHDGFFLLKSP